MLTALWYFLAGYVIIKIDGLWVHRFLTECAARGIRVDDVKAQKAGVCTAKMAAGSFFLLRAVAKKTGCRVKILQKRGAPFLFFRFADRPMLYAGALGFLALLVIGSRCVWRVELIGGDEAARKNAFRAIENCGVRPFMEKSQLKLEELKTAIELSDPSIAWAGAQLDGGALTLRVIEKKPLPEQKAMASCDIVAKKSALIHSVVPINGKAVVSAGQAVSKDQTLISGFMEARENAPARYVAAKGEATGVIHYAGLAHVSRVQRRLKPTGRAETAYTFMTGGQTAEFGASFEQCVVTAQREYTLCDLYLPIGLLVQEREELAYANVSLSDAELGALALESARKNALEAVEKTARIISETPSVYVGADSAVARHVVQTIEDIAKINAKEYIFSEDIDGAEDRS